MSTTLIKSLRILESVAQSEEPRGITELSRELELNKSAVQRLLQTLVEAGYLEKAQGGRYRSTLRIWELGSHIITHHEARRLVHPILRYGAQLTGLTAYFAWCDFPDALYLDKVEGAHGRPNSSEPGRRVWLPLAASGRAILAFLDDEVIARVGAIPTAQRQGDAPSKELPADLREQLDAVRHRMYAVSQSGSVSRVNSIAAPVWGSGPAPVGSIALTSDSTSLPESDFDRLGHIAVSLGEQATRVLGGIYPGVPTENP